MLPHEPGSFPLAECPGDPGALCVSVCCAVTVEGVSLCGCITVCFPFSHCSHSGCFQFGAITNKAAANICVRGTDVCVGNHMGWLAFRLLCEEGRGVGGARGETGRRLLQGSG